MLAWGSSRGVSLAPADSPRQWSLLATPPVVGVPAWSPDGSRIVVAVMPSGGNARLVLVDVLSGRVVDLTAGDSFDWQPAWSPDGTAIAFIRGHDTEATLSVLAIDSGSVAPVAPAMSAARPAWSPDSTRIAFEARDAGQESVWVVGRDGGGLVQLAPELVAAVQPAWAPDGTEVVVSGRASPAGFDLYLAPSRGGRATRVTDGPGSEWSPAWLASQPDAIYYLATTEGPGDVWRLDLRTRITERLTRTSGGATASFTLAP